MNRVGVDCKAAYVAVLPSTLECNTVDSGGWQLSVHCVRCLVTSQGEIVTRINVETVVGNIDVASEGTFTRSDSVNHCPAEFYSLTVLNSHVPDIGCGALIVGETVAVCVGEISALRRVGINLCPMTALAGRRIGASAVEQCLAIADYASHIGCCCIIGNGECRITVLDVEVVAVFATTLRSYRPHNA